MIQKILYYHFELIVKEIEIDILSFLIRPKKMNKLYKLNFLWTNIIDIFFDDILQKSHRSVFIDEELTKMTRFLHIPSNLISACIVFKSSLKDITADKWVDKRDLIKLKKIIQSTRRGDRKSFNYHKDNHKFIDQSLSQSNIRWDYHDEMR